VKAALLFLLVLLAGCMALLAGCTAEQDPKRLVLGEKLYGQHCAACHGASLEEIGRAHV